MDIDDDIAPLIAALFTIFLLSDDDVLLLCNTGGDDCHLITVEASAELLFAVMGENEVACSM